jgi:Holliday junction resolvase RusA-like endonuclease
VAKQYRQSRAGIIYAKGHVHSWELTVAQHAMVAAGAGYKPHIGPVEFKLEFRFPIAKSRKELQPGHPHLEDPDLTNLLKATEDGLKRVLFVDDNLVRQILVWKHWVAKGDEGVNVTVWLYEV